MTRPVIDGLLVIDKPAGMTSRDVVNRAQGWFPRHTRIGHTGTLDPLATGVLVVCVGIATRLTEYIQRMGKIYRAGVTLGAGSDTDDADGQIVPFPHGNVPACADVAQALRAFLGEIEQVPPAYSAAKVTGRRAYDLARRGQAVSLAARKVRVDAIDVLTYDFPRLEIEVHCGKGTYIRSLARDLGQRLGCGGYITSLRRLQVGCFKAADALSLDMDPATARQRLLPFALALHDLPRIILPAQDAGRLLHGQSLPAPNGLPAATTEAALFTDAGRLLAVVTVADGVLRPCKVFVGAAENGGSLNVSNPADLP